MNRKRYRLHIWYAYSTNKALSIDTKVNDLVTFNVTFVLKIAFSDFVAAGGIVFHKNILFIMHFYDKLMSHFSELGWVD